MAYLIKRDGLYYLCHRATEDGKRTRFCTRFKVDVGEDVRAAKALKAEYSMKEHQSGARMGPKFRAEERWENWVEEYFRIRYRNNAGTFRRWQSMWKTLQLFFKDKGIEIPRQLKRQHCFDYLAWRITPTIPKNASDDEKKAILDKIEADKKRGKFKAVHNTAHVELAALRKIMKEAVQRRFIDANPAAELGIGQDEKKKPCELTDEMLKKLEAYITTQTGDDYLRLYRSYMLGRYHGVRLHETHLDPCGTISTEFETFKVVDLEKNTIVFRQKGNRVRMKPLHPKLIPMFKEMQDAGARETFPLPKSFTGYWYTHMDKSGLKEMNTKACFHSLRVTAQNRLRRAGVNDEIRRAYLSHEKKGDVHEGYSRINVDELKVCHAAL